MSYTLLVYDVPYHICPKTCIQHKYTHKGNVMKFMKYSMICVIMCIYMKIKRNKPSRTLNFNPVNETRIKCYFLSW